MQLNIKNLYTGSEYLKHQTLLIENHKIVGIQNYTGKAFDYENLAPALIDLHINGGEKFHFTAAPNFETLQDMEESALKNGVGYILPALITSSLENIFKAIEVVRQYRQKNPNTGILGLHLEGPFISVAKRGAHLSKYIISPTDELLEKIIHEGKDVVRMMTIAPEHFSNTQIQRLLESDIKISIGHSNCSFERATEVFELGVDLVTHLYNAMSPLHHRQPGLVGAALMHPKVYTPVIPDGIHAHFEAVKLAIQQKKDHLFFISDALFQNLKLTRFQWEEFDVNLLNGNYMNADGNLAGATISMADAVKNGVQVLQLTLEDAIKKCTQIPASVLTSKIGKIEVGYPAKFCTFNQDLTHFTTVL